MERKDGKKGREINRRGCANEPSHFSESSDASGNSLPTCLQNFTTVASGVPEIWLVPTKF